MRWTLTISLLALLAACGAERASERPGADAGAARDAGADAGDLEDRDGGTAEGGARDAAEAGDAAIPDAGPDALPSTCEGDCRTLSVAIDFGGTTGRFDRAFYGLTAPSESASGEWELHLEAIGGGAPGCPDESSPTPSWTLILRLPLFTSPEPLTEATPNTAVTLLDFDGRFITGARPISRATRFTLTPAAADVCTTCLGEAPPAHPEGFVAFDLDATFAEGAIRGRVFATHCDSFDEG